MTKTPPNPGYRDSIGALGIVALLILAVALIG